MRLEPVAGTNILFVDNDEIRLGHTWHEVDVIKRIIRKEDPEWFIEIGVHEGGLSKLLIPEYIDMHYLGIELDTSLTREIVKQTYRDFGHELLGLNCFDINLLSRVAKLPRKIIYCDGGNKSQELMAYKHCMQKGDLIFTHDFWDGIRKVHSVSEVHPEVYPLDILHMDTSEFERYPEKVLRATRIVGWRKL